ncbi:MAG: Lar family restriction alleviation protein [Synergistaceae bacterium]|nr:Lar family restriction alleviation protein [Synergistaceae bacterium]
MIELKPCPFCGSRLVSYTHGVTRAPIVYMKCGNPECCAIVSFNNNACHLLPEKAIVMWNRREQS